MTRSRTLRCPPRNLPTCAGGLGNHCPSISIVKNRSPGEGTGPACFVLPPVHTLSFSTAKTKGTETGTSTLFRCQLQTSTWRLRQVAFSRDILEAVPEMEQRGSHSFWFRNEWELITSSTSFRLHHSSVPHIQCEGPSAWGPTSEVSASRLSKHRVRRQHTRPTPLSVYSHYARWR